jgi:regulator of replication initiation timing
MDVSVDVLNNVIKELQDLRDYLVATVKENNALKLRIEKFKKALDND